MGHYIYVVSYFKYVCLFIHAILIYYSLPLYHSAAAQKVLGAIKRSNLEFVVRFLIHVLAGFSDQHSTEIQLPPKIIGIGSFEHRCTSKMT